MKAKELIEKSFKKYSAKQLISKLEKGNLSSVETEIAIKILKKRGQNTSKWETEAQNEEKSVETVDKSTSVKEDIDRFVDQLIEQKRTGVYTEVMKALGGKFDDDLDELLEKATQEQLKDAISFKGLDKAKIVEKKEVRDANTEDKPKVSRAKRGSKTKELFEVEFTTAKNSKKAPNKTLKGIVIKEFVCPKVDKEFYKIKTEFGVFTKKAISCKKI
jgi:hypothetical protein